uniref:RING-type E3 ubiquitin transferase n=1 Tax=Kalanchoe fedtschenkoi TaxID=63787 RepID=A0A7N0VA13_KALFE
MGGSWSANKRRNNYLQHPQPPASSPPMILPPPPPPSSRPTPPPDHASSSSAAAPLQNYAYAPNPNPPSYSYPSNPTYHHPAPPPPPYSMYAAPPYHAPPSYYGAAALYSQCGYVAPPVVNGGGYAPYYVNQYNGWASYRPPPHGVAMQQAPPPKFVEHQNAKKVKNYVNVRKDSVKVKGDEQNPDHFLVSFEFDAEHDGSITVYYFAKVEDDCKISPLFPEAHTPVKVPFQKGPGQRFQQASGTGIDLGFFELDDLAKPSPAEDVFPLVISAETSVPTDGQPDEHMPIKSPHMQITQAVLLKKDTGFQVKVMKQILWIDEVRYELRDLFGIGSSSTAESPNDDNDDGKECVICLTEPKDTAVLPCRHMCMCSDCAKALRLQSNKCPICRQPIEEIIEIKIENKGN